MSCLKPFLLFVTFIYSSLLYAETEIEKRHLSFQTLFAEYQKGSTATLDSSGASVFNGDCIQMVAPQWVSSHSKKLLVKSTSEGLFYSLYNTEFSVEPTKESLLYRARALNLNENGGESDRLKASLDQEARFFSVPRQNGDRVFYRMTHDAGYFYVLTYHEIYQEGTQICRFAKAQSQPILGF